MSINWLSCYDCPVIIQRILRQQIWFFLASLCHRTCCKALTSTSSLDARSWMCEFGQDRFRIFGQRTVMEMRSNEVYVTSKSSERYGAAAVLFFCNWAIMNDAQSDKGDTYFSSSAGYMMYYRFSRISSNQSHMILAASLGWASIQNTPPSISTSRFLTRGSL